jgi:two-component system, cell cycle response regulator
VAVARKHVLIVDDHPDNVDLLRHRLESRGYRISVALDGEDALRAVGLIGGPLPEETPLPDLILLDVMLPKVAGFEVARRIKAEKSLPFIPIVMQTALDSTESKVEGLDAGADDYITKPIDFAELEARVRSWLRIKALQDEVERQSREILRISQTDALTEIDNRRYLEERLHETFEHAKRMHEPFACVMCDLDLFKSVNDNYGHQAGDVVLKQLAQLLKSEAREIDRVGRYGGEEFMLILPGTSAEAAMRFADRVRNAVAQRTFAFEGGSVARTISCGVAGWPHPRIADVDALVRAADDALYVAKETGRNRVVRFDSPEFTSHAGKADGQADGKADDGDERGREHDNRPRAVAHTPDTSRGAAARA